MRAVLIFLLAVIVARAQQPPAAPDPLAGISPEEIENGRRLFQKNCATCHGIDGSGGTGPSLARPTLMRAPDNNALIDLISEGIPDTGMPPSWHLLPHGPKQVAAYVRTLGRVEEAPITGNIEHGRAVYRSAGCGNCHIVKGEGGSLGPELTGIGARRTAGLLRQSILDPSAAVPEGFFMVRAHPKVGAEVRGIRVNEDSFTIQIKDAAGRFLSLRKSDLIRLEKDSGQTWMPNFAGKISGSDLDDLVGYLTRLRGAQ